jgi:hypothetical protein
MNTRAITTIGMAALVAQLAFVYGCSSSPGSSTGTAGTNGGGTAGTSGAGTAGTSGGTAGTSGGTAGDTGTAGTGGTDPYCTSTTAKSGMACTQNCTLGCGFAPNNGGAPIGSKTCTCTSGTYSSCPCTKPADLTITTAPACSTIPGNDGGVSTSLDGMPCNNKYDACIGNEACNGSSCKGCLCLMDGDPTKGLTWQCSATNGWFTLQ